MPVYWQTDRMAPSSRAIPPGKESAMTVRDLIDRLLVEIQSGELKGSDSVPADLLEEDVLERYGVTEYIAEKYGIEEVGKHGD